MHVVGLLGGVASGKSAVAAALAAHGAVVLDADTAAHAAINRPDVHKVLQERWGAQVLDSEGNVDRSIVASKVFADTKEAKSELKFLEDLLHPIVRADFEQELTSLAQTDCLAVVIDAPLLLEAGWGELCDHLLFVESASEDRCKRAKSRNWTPTELSRREAAQLPIEKKREAATHIVHNQGSLQDLEVEVARFWKLLQSTERS